MLDKGRDEVAVAAAGGLEHDENVAVERVEEGRDILRRIGDALDLG
ncbi:hypothetical protein [Aureimonas ureilytica]|nr:hypothetical protein [Aureimonas ureilytica]